MRQYQIYLAKYKQLELTNQEKENTRANGGYKFPCVEIFGHCRMGNSCYG